MTPGISFLEKFPASEIGLKIKSLFPAGRHSDILGRIDASLLLFDNTLINTASGAAEEIIVEEGKSYPEAMALAARRLVSGNEGKNILLLLPTVDFIATFFSMHMSGEKLIRSALELQAQSLIPAYDEKLLLAVDAGNQDGVALWFNEKEANRMFRAFSNEGMFLGAIMPRSLALLDETEEGETRTTLINDEEGSNISFMQIRGTSIRRLLTVNKADLEQDVFARQWDIETGQLKGDSVKNMTTMDDWMAIRRMVKAVPEYCFMPAGAIVEERRIDFARKSKVAMGIAACLVLLLFAPFVANWMTLRELQQDLEVAEMQSEEPRMHQASIFDMEQEWGALYEYPDQRVTEVLVSLNQVIQSSLTSFSINKGVIDITGSTSDPAYLMELLAEREEFNNVSQSSQSRAGGSQFGLRMNLSGVDFGEYEEKYPVITQGR